MSTAAKPIVSELSAVQSGLMLLSLLPLDPCSLRKRLSVSESSHTESDSSPPLTVRRRCSSAIIEMPRFAISSEEEGIGRSPSLLCPGSAPLPPAIPELPLERELRLDESSPATLTGQTNCRGQRSDHFPVAVLMPLSISAPSAASSDDAPSTTQAISDLAARRARHRLLSAETPTNTATPVAPPTTTSSYRPLNKVIKSASATALSLMIPAGQLSGVKGHHLQAVFPPLIAFFSLPPPTFLCPSPLSDHYAVSPLASPMSPRSLSSNPSSRDSSPSRDLSPAASRPAIVIQRAGKKYGFTLRAIRVYMGDSDVYTVQHMVWVSPIYQCHDAPAWAHSAAGTS